MMKETNEILFPAVGCMLGQAYQKLLTQLADALDRVGAGISPAEYLVLRAVYSNDGIRLCEIAELVGKDKSAICRCVSALESKGLIRTEAVSHKCLRVHIAQKGEELRPKITEVAETRHKALSEMLTPEDLNTFIRVLRTIINQ